MADVNSELVQTVSAAQARSVISVGAIDWYSWSLHRLSVEQTRSLVVVWFLEMYCELLQTVSGAQIRSAVAIEAALSYSAALQVLGEPGGNDVGNAVTDTEGANVGVGVGAAVVVAPAPAVGAAVEVAPAPAVGAAVVVAPAPVVGAAVGDELGEEDGIDVSSDDS
jgi:hypothetical protein